MACMCGDTHCHSCGPAQGNHRCDNCGEWMDDHAEHFKMEKGDAIRVTKYNLKGHHGVILSETGPTGYGESGYIDFSCEYSRCVEIAASWPEVIRKTRPHMVHRVRLMDENGDSTDLDRLNFDATPDCKHDDEGCQIAIQAAAEAEAEEYIASLRDSDPPPGAP